MTSRNNVADGASSVCFGLHASSDRDYEAASDTTASGSNSRNSQTFTFVDPDNDDYHLDPSDTGAKGFGVDLSATFDDDIDGDTITEWSIGADAQVAAAESSGWMMKRIRRLRAKIKYERERYYA